MEKHIQLVGRILIAVSFVIPAFGMIADFTITQVAMDTYGVPGMLLPVVIVFLLGMSMSLLIGWKLPWSYALLALFCIVAGVVFHSDWSSFEDRNALLRNIGIAGGLIALSVKP